MGKTEYPDIDAYLALQPPQTRELLQRIREVIQRTLPQATEAISYQIPAFKLEGTALIFFAGWKAHYSLYPVSAEVLRKVGEDPSRFTVSKGTLRFPLNTPVDEALIARIVTLQAEEAQERRTRKQTARKAKKTPAEAPAARRGGVRGRPR